MCLTYLLRIYVVLAILFIIKMTLGKFLLGLVPVFVSSCARICVLTSCATIDFCNFFFHIFQELYFSCVCIV